MVVLEAYLRDLPMTPAVMLSSTLKMTVQRLKDKEGTQGHPTMERMRVILAMGIVPVRMSEFGVVVLHVLVMGVVIDTA